MHLKQNAKAIEEFEYRLQCHDEYFQNYPLEQGLKTAPPENHYMVYNQAQWQHFQAGVNWLYLQNLDAAQAHLAEVMPLLKQSMAACYSIELPLYFSYFQTALLLGLPEDANEAANIVAKLEPASNRASELMQVLMAKLWLGYSDIPEAWLKTITRSEQNKGHSLIYVGFSAALKAFAGSNKPALASAITTILEHHRHVLRYLRWTANITQLYETTSTLLVIIAKQRGWNIKPMIGTTQYQIKIRPEDYLHREGMTSKTRVEVCTDFLPDVFVDNPVYR
ncbi:hypothetical protein [Neptunicella marina]|uniref:Uncharacterized protein n=1 Tax=Neptunicella marina TaxID=2125989 RepID=A0A8J6LZI1_9ALTE|nr:hypothetical protein [Neptunicella marina]MBC3766160.1 hypothetical protein [Neptunicella marina]